MGFGDDKKNLRNMEFVACFREGSDFFISLHDLLTEMSIQDNIFNWNIISLRTGSASHICTGRDRSKIFADDRHYSPFQITNPSDWIWRWLWARLYLVSVQATAETEINVGPGPEPTSLSLLLQGGEKQLHVNFKNIFSTLLSFII